MSKKRASSDATQLVELALRRSEPWHARDGEPYATVDVGRHREHLKIGSKEFSRWLSRLSWCEIHACPSGTAVRDASNTLAGLATYEGDEHAVHLRVAGVGDKVWIDLVDKQWRAIEIDSNGWRIVDAPPVRFVRRKAMTALPEPLPGGTMNELREHVRIADDSWPLVVGWLAGAYAPSGPYPALAFRGSHGAGKSWAARQLRSLIDPSIADIRSEPREPRDLVISAKAAHVMALDNLSSIPPWLSDGLCRLATGGGYAARALYTDDDEIVIDVQRPVILTGITDVVTAPDLLDRCLLVELDAIAPKDRRTERALLAAWAAGPQRRLIGTLCSAMATALRRRDDIKLAILPRLADWAELATAAEPALGLDDGAILAALDEHADEATTIALEASVIASPLRDFVAEQPNCEWLGTPGELLNVLSARVDPHLVARDKKWPKTARGLAGAIARIAKALADTGLVVEKPRRGSAGVRGGRPLRLVLVEQADRNGLTPPQQQQLRRDVDPFQPDWVSAPHPADHFAEAWGRIGRRYSYDTRPGRWDEWIQLWRAIGARVRHEWLTATMPNGKPRPAN